MTVVEEEACTEIKAAGQTFHYRLGGHQGEYFGIIYAPDMPELEHETGLEPALVVGGMLWVRPMDVSCGETVENTGCAVKFRWSQNEESNVTPQQLMAAAVTAIAVWQQYQKP